MKSMLGTAVLVQLFLFGMAWAGEPNPIIRSARDGRWTEPASWEGGRVPGAGTRVQIQAGHAITYDAHTDAVVRSIHVAGTLRFDPDRDTRLDVGLIKIQAGNDAGESGFDCEMHPAPMESKHGRATLEVGAPDHPIARAKSALIRLTPVSGLDPEECPAIVCCGGRMEFHGAELSRAWVELGATADKGATAVVLAEPVTGWRVGDRVIVTATTKQRVPDQGDIPSSRARPLTEERVIRAIDGPKLTLDAPLAFTHSGQAELRGEVANLSRNVVVESADPAAGNRGHTMYHRHSSGSISYAEFRHLGKPGKLGKYSLHFHRVGDTMRGASVVGASIWDSGNRWITIHGTNYLVVRDCVGYGSIGHGFFLEDGTEVDNILDHNLAVQACDGKPLPGQALPFDHNEGAGFWWANSRNAFTGNVAVECDQYGFRYDAQPISGFDGILPVRGVDGVVRPTDVRTLPFLLFEGNVAHSQRRYGFNLGGGPGLGALGGVGGVGPDKQHPFEIRGLRVWETHWGVTLAAPGVLVDDLAINRCDFGMWRPRYERHAYRKLKMYHTAWAFYAEQGKQPNPSVYPAPLEPTDDRPPVTVVTSTSRSKNGRLVVRGVAVDNRTIRGVEVNGHKARPVAPGYARWEVEIDGHSPGPVALVALATDEAGNQEQTPHRLSITVR
jgi:G8 domain